MTNGSGRRHMLTKDKSGSECEIRGLFELQAPRVYHSE